jgi:hypothetical protein
LGGDGVNFIEAIEKAQENKKEMQGKGINE